MVNNISGYIDVGYFIKFVIVLVGFYYFNLWFLGITDPQNFYSPFLDHNLNYISWVTASILQTSNGIEHTLGIQSFVAGKLIAVPKGAGVLLNYTCLGFGILGFWIAFILAHKINWKRKLFWCVMGMSAIWLINVGRITVLLLALQNKWKGNNYMDHHDMFNVAAYCIIFLLIYFYNRESRKSSPDEVIVSKKYTDISVL